MWGGQINHLVNSYKEGTHCRAQKHLKGWKPMKNNWWIKEELIPWGWVVKIKNSLQKKGVSVSVSTNNRHNHSKCRGLPQGTTGKPQKHKSQTGARNLHRSLANIRTSVVQYEEVSFIFVAKNLHITQETTESLKMLVVIWRKVLQVQRAEQAVSSEDSCQSCGFIPYTAGININSCLMLFKLLKNC